MFLPHLFRALALHLGRARRRSPEHAGSDAHRQVEGVHLVVVRLPPDALQHGHHVAQQEQVLGRQQVEQPDAEETLEMEEVQPATSRMKQITARSGAQRPSHLWTEWIFFSSCSTSIASIHWSYRSTHNTLPGMFRRKSWW